MLKPSPDTDMQAFSVEHVGMLEGLDTMKTIIRKRPLSGGHNRESLDYE